MKIAKIAFELEATVHGPTVVMTVCDADENILHRKAASYEIDPNQGAALLFEYLAGVMREIYLEEDGSPTWTWHK